MSVEKQFLKSRPECKVKFRITKDQAPDVGEIFLVGDFNEWDESATPMTKLKSGDFTAVLYLPLEQEVEFRYLVDGETWMTEVEADKLADTPYPDVKNSVIVT